MGIKLDRLMEVLGLDIEWTEEEKAEIKERREKLNQPLDHIADDIRARKVLKRIKELVEFVDSLKCIYVDNITSNVTVRKGQIVVDNKNEEDDYKYGNGVMDMLQ